VVCDPKRDTRYVWRSLAGNIRIRPRAASRQCPLSGIKLGRVGIETPDFMACFIVAF
jgi:hypothetical protein